MHFLFPLCLPSVKQPLVSEATFSLTLTSTQSSLLADVIFSISTIFFLYLVSLQPPALLLFPSYPTHVTCPCPRYRAHCLLSLPVPPTTSVYLMSGLLIGRFRGSLAMTHITMSDVIKSCYSPVWRHRLTVRAPPHITDLLSKRRKCYFLF